MTADIWFWAATIVVATIGFGGAIVLGMVRSELGGEEERRRRGEEAPRR